MEVINKNTLPPFSEKEMDIIKEHLLNNIATDKNIFTKRVEGKKITSLPGAVIAAPATQGLNFTQDYVFRWTRDGAITMATIVALYSRTKDLAEKDRLRSYIINYINFASICSSQPPLNKIEIYGEPKFNIDGTLWTGAWGRPQNDGPALLAIVAIQMAKIFLAEKQEQALIDKLYHHSNQSLIKGNLEYIAHHWADPSFGAWEEVKGSHFMRSCVQRRALYEGAELANQLGDSKAGIYYIEQAKELEKFMMKYWSQEMGYFRESIDEGDSRGGGIDITTIMGLMYGRMVKTGDSFSVLHSRSLSTAFFVRNSFENLYEINLKIKHTSDSGPLIGRYQDDHYDGDQGLYGNPWFLTTNNFAEYYYAVADELLRAGSFELSFMSIQFFKQIAPEIVLEEDQVLSYQRNRDLFEKMLAALITAGDKMLIAVKTFAVTYADGSTLHMSEQIDRRSGQQKSATDLTWSYASTISALLARETTMKLWQNL
jgi:glucoamylase